MVREPRLDGNQRAPNLHFFKLNISPEALKNHREHIPSGQIEHLVNKQEGGFGPFNLTEVPY